MFTREEVPYRLLSLGTGILGGAIAGAVVTRVWRAFSGADELPNPAALDRHSREVLIAGAVQGAVFGLVKAALSRLTAKGYRRFTGSSAASDPTERSWSARMVLSPGAAPTPAS